MQKIRGLAHRIKGAAANLHAVRLSKAAENLELPHKQLWLRMEQGDEVSEEERRRVLDASLKDPTGGLVILLQEFQRFTEFVKNEALDNVRSSYGLC